MDPSDDVLLPDVTDPFFLVGQVTAGSGGATSAGCRTHGATVGGGRRDRCQRPHAHGRIVLVALRTKMVWLNDGIDL